MDRRDWTQQNPRAWQRSRSGRFSRAVSSTDGRWAVVSTSLTAIVAGTVAWLAIGTVPPSGSMDAGIAPQRTLLPYQLFQQLAHASRDSYASLGPSTVPGYREIDATGGHHELDSALAAERAGDNGNAAPGLESHTITLDRGDTLVGALTDAGAGKNDANAAIAALGRVFDLRSLRAGTTLTLTFQSDEPQDSGDAVVQPIDQVNLNGDSEQPNDDSSGAFIPSQGSNAGRLLSVSFSPSVEHDVTVMRLADGTFTASDSVKKLEAHVHRAGATIDSSLYLAAMQAGIPADVVVEMIHMFSYKVDFQRDLKPGDSFEVFYDYYYTPDGHAAKQGQISYAVMKLSGREIALYRYQPHPDEPADYFDAHGQSAKGMLMKTPVDGARITSGFGMRFHPILGYSRMHKGVDFGVPTGTPVMAAGAGTIAFMGVQHGYGNFVLINHGNGYSTAYAHLSRFAPGLRRGARVRQGQVFAYSGMTGMATGPHLHYEIRVNNVQVNPTTVRIAQGRRLEGRELRDYLVDRLHTDAMIANTPLETRLADAGSDLRQAKSK
ncbi:MAG: M23 family metallopeptidase [Alphaproteobacteria bacterium]|nr:M23 family metallopeptidase [Alphaproteobacteria bacterium]